MTIAIFFARLALVGFGLYYKHSLHRQEEARPRPEVRRSVRARQSGRRVRSRGGPSDSRVRDCASRSAPPVRYCAPAPVSVAKTCSAVRGSRLPVGSSASSRCGALATARAMATRCCSPPESSDGRCEGARSQTQIIEQFLRPPASPRAIEAIDRLRQRHIFQRREFRQKMVELIDEADRVAPQTSCARRRSSRGRRVFDLTLRRRRGAPTGRRYAAASICRRPRARCSATVSPGR